MSRAVDAAIEAAVAVAATGVIVPSAANAGRKMGNRIPEVRSNRSTPSSWKSIA